MTDSESARLDALRGYQILDTPPAESFDRITRLAARLFKVPIALISLVDEKRQWFKSRCGLALEQTDRNIAFSAQAILSRDVTIVPDAREDPRFADNPLVTGPPFARFYAGAPLVDSAGFALGTLCLFGTEPRGLSRPGVETLQDFARMVTEQIERESEAVSGRSEQLEIEKQLQQAQKMEVIGQLTGGLAHDFNNLLTIVIGNLQLLEQDLAKDPERGRRLNAALEAATRGAKLTRQLLAFSRRQVLEPEIVNLRQHVVELEQLLKRTLGDAIDIHTSVASDTHSINVDSSLLESALLNLAINARDAMNGQGQLNIDVRNVTLDKRYVAGHQGLTPGEYVRISVRDTGCGMSREVLDRVFEPFFTTKGPSKGTGLGLSMVYAFARQSKGLVKMSSDTGIGTRVELYLPQATAAEIEDELRLTGRYQAIPSGSERVLVVEDNAGVRQIAVTLLKSLGYEIIEAPGGWEALEIMARDRNIDLLFTDIVMPGGMNGVELAQKAQALRPKLRVLFTSGYTDNTIVHDGQVRPGALLLSKPYRTQELAVKVRQALDDPVPEAVAG